MSSRRNRACYQMPSYTGHRFFVLFGKSFKTYCGLVKLQILRSIKGAFSVLTVRARLRGEGSSSPLLFVIPTAAVQRSQPPVLALYPPETLLPPPNWLTPRQGYDLKSLALLIRFLLKFSELTEYQRLCACAAGLLQGLAHGPPSQRCRWSSTWGETLQAFSSLNLPLWAQWDFVKWRTNISLGSEADFLIASELSLTDRIFYSKEGEKPETWGVCVFACSFFYGRCSDVLVISSHATWKAMAGRVEEQRLFSIFFPN